MVFKRQNNAGLLGVGQASLYRFDTPFEGILVGKAGERGFVALIETDGKGRAG